MTRTLNRWLPALTLTIWGGILLYFYGSGRLAAFLHPMFRPWVLVAGIGLLILAIGSALGGETECCEEDACGHGLSRLTFGKLLAFAVLLLPVSLALFSTKDGFSLNAILNRGVVTDISELASLRSGPMEVPSDIDHLTVSVIDLLFAAQDERLQTELTGKTLEIVGQLMEETESNPRGNRKRLVRLFMNCCAADSKPVGALIEFQTLPETPFKEMEWVRVIGKPSFPMEGGRRIGVLKVESIDATEAPDESMLY